MRRGLKECLTVIPDPLVSVEEEEEKKVKISKLGSVNHLADDGDVAI